MTGTSTLSPVSLDKPRPQVRNGLLFLGLLQGLLLLALARSGLAPGWQALCMLLVVLPPAFMAMAVTRWNDRRLWAGGAVMAAVVGVMAGG